MERKDWAPEKYNANISVEVYDLIMKCADKVLNNNAVKYSCAQPNNSASSGTWYHFPGYGYTWVDFATTEKGRLSGVKFNVLQTRAWHVWDLAFRDEGTLSLNSMYNKACVVKSIMSETFRAEKGTYLKPGKLIQAIFPTVDAGGLNLSAQIASALALELRKMVEIDISNISVSENPSKIYQITHHDSGSIGSSCMADKPACTFEIYDDVCKIAYLLGDDGVLVGRALLHDNVVIHDTNQTIKLMDRIYCTNDDVLVQFIIYANENGYYQKEVQSLSCKNYISPDGDILEEPILSISAKNLREEYKKVPYIDTFRHYHKQSVTLCSHDWNGEENAVTTFDETNGTDNNHLFTGAPRSCMHCDNNENDCEIIYMNEYDVDVCSYCLGTMYSYCDSCDRYVPNEEMEPINVGRNYEYYCSDCVRAVAVQCDYCGCNVDPDYIETTEDDYSLCSNCYEDQTSTCEHCDKTYYRSYLVYNGICNTCIEEEEEERIKEEMEEAN